MYAKIGAGGAAGAGAVSALPETGGLPLLGLGVEAAIVFVAVFTLAAAVMAALQLIPRKEE